MTDRAESTSATRLEEVARQVAVQHALATEPGGQPLLLARLDDYAATLQRTYQGWAEATEQDLLLPFAAEWLLDNYYVVRQAFRQVEKDLPPIYYRELPLVESTAGVAVPRVYAVAHAIVRQGTLQPAMEAVIQFLGAYQALTPLTMGELWAVPIMLRYTLIEQLAYAVARLTEPGDLPTPLVSTPVVQTESEPATSDDQLVADAIVGLRAINSADWNEIFEAVSLVHQLLCEDPAGVYAHMTYGTRDRYRAEVEHLARYSVPTEIEVAQLILDMARQATAGHGNEGADGRAGEREAHVGYFLLDRGRSQLEAALDYRPPTAHRLRRWAYAHPEGLYLGSIAVVSLAALVLAVVVADAVGGAWWQSLLVALLGVVPAVTVAVGVVNWVLTLLLPPWRLPKLDLEEGVPSTAQTMVVIPALLNQPDDVDDLFRQLELHYLRNLDPNHHVRFAVLTDFGDAPEATMPGDAELLAHACDAVAELNRRYPDRPFYFLHRQRLWNPSEGVWMGWERKRGKLHEFNRLLRTPVDPATGDLVENGTSFVVVEGDCTVLPQVRYVITLDADTVLPRDAARRLIATLAHPLNRAEFDPATGRVVAGYTVLQPRTEINVTSARRSLFTQLFAGDRGIDLYTLAVSDVYQDLFGEGIYVGKGIYDVDAFERSLAGRVPENALLSHDLFEGIHGRAGLVTDIVLFEDYPPHYLVNVRRSHRWVRGDWQLLPWLGREVPAADGTVPNRLSPLARWKILDNLRRSLLPPVLLLWFVAAWTVLPGPAWLWTLAAIAVLGVPTITEVLSALVRSIKAGDQHVVTRAPWKDGMRWLLQLAFLPYEALINAHAIAITLVRLRFTRRHMLEWVTAAHAARLLGGRISMETIVQQMMPALAVLAPIVVVTVWLRPRALPAAVPVWLLWALAAEIAHLISRPVQPAGYALSSEELRRLRMLARRTWLFYEQFVGPEDHWLPPDHFQESPKGVVAHRTSPTNVGLYLLAVLVGHDLGYVNSLNLVLRLRSAFDTLARLEHYRGHLLNWFDTHDLSTLTPAYVSTVDSGNLAASLVALKQGCLGLIQQPLLRWELWQGLLDGLALLEEEVHGVRPESAAEVDGAQETRQQLLDETRAWRDAIAAVQEQPEVWPDVADRLEREARPRLDQALVAFVETHPEMLDSTRLHTLRSYMTMLHRHLTNMQHEFNLLTPWHLVVAHTPRPLADGSRPDVLDSAWEALRRRVPEVPTLGDAAAAYDDMLGAVDRLRQSLHGAVRQDLTPEEVEEADAWCRQLVDILQMAQGTAQQLCDSLKELAAEAAQMVAEMDFGFLYDHDRRLFHIGYNVTAGRLDANYYDLLASEARLASLIAIAKYEVPQRHWLQMGRPFAMVDGRPVLLSWSGTMFEYLMPLLLAHSYPGTLLHESCRVAVARQRAYGREHDVPWGISESGFYQFDSAMNYQYRAFGVPGLGLKRGLDEDLVIAPYASLMAIGLAPEAVLHNLERLQREGMEGRFGLYEAADYTERRLPVGQERSVVRSYMAHHQGMILLAMANYLQNDRMVERFHADTAVQSVELLLQEQLPAAPTVNVLAEDTPAAPKHVGVPAPSTQPWRVPVDSAFPQVRLLSNGRLVTAITNQGAGFSTWKTLTLTRWRPDPTLDDWGVWIYVQDLASGAYWRVCHQPGGRGSATEVEGEEPLFFPHMAEFRQRRGTLGMQLEVVVAPDADVEIRRLTLINSGDDVVRLRVTSYGEVVLGDGASDLRHQAFAKLFVESEYLPQFNALLFRRRPRAATEQPHFMAHALVAPSGTRTGAHESDRVRFLGRGRTIHRPAALEDPEWLSGTTGATLDPVMALGEEVEIAPHGVVELAFLTAAAESRQEVQNLLARYRTWPTLALAFSAARNQADQLLREQGVGADDVALFDQMLALLLYPHRQGRAQPEILAANRLGQSALWAYGISGDYPMVLAQVADAEQSLLLRRLIQAHTYWRRRGLTIDLVIANTQETNYGQAVQGAIRRLIQRMDAEQTINQRGGIFIVRRDQMRPEEYTLLQSSARVVVDAERGPLDEQLQVATEAPSALPDLITTAEPEPVPGDMPPLRRPEDLRFDNGWGGFSSHGREYIVYLEPGAMTPAPWINVIANEEFGFLATDSGGGYSWAVNSGENRLTAWRNDPVTDMPAEALYVRDEETGEVWSPTPLPAPSPAPYLVRHGSGYTSYEHHARGLVQRVRLFGDPDAPVKYVQVRLRNHLPRVRRLTVTFYAEWVLGVNRALSAQYILPEYAGDGAAALLATNPYNAEFATRCAFLATNKPIHGFTTDRTEFLGRNGEMARPAALRRVGLSNRVEPGLDPCGVLQVHVTLPPESEEEFVFVLGEGQDRADALDLVARYCTEEAAAAAWAATQERWQAILGTVQVATPEPSMDLLLNRWLLYQSLTCRIWGRSALYQSSGAYGFRDQLQDVMAAIHARPDVTRAQLLRAARHQFKEGDVLHWWHPPSGRGVRTRISDDLLWLPYVTAHYVAATGDREVLAERVPFLEGEPLRPDEEERYAEYRPDRQEATLYEHCRRALLKGATRGPHGLPLMGGGDWNDGMNRVGIEGRGESIWLGWFLHATETAFAQLAEAEGMKEEAAHWRARAADLADALEAHGWDGEWYLRAYYDDGTPLGSAQNQECQIDSIAQSWAVLSGAGDPARAQQAMAAVRERLVREDVRLILLFTPPFNRTRRDPGYIKGYLPGVRENGGQYTHAALWSIWAWTKLGDGTLATSLFQMINPIERAGTPAGAQVYKVEPYVISADVYGVEPHVGRGGWTWYTGSCGWMYRLGIEGILGLRRGPDHLWLDPCIPRQWPGFRIDVRVGETLYCFTVENPLGVEQGVAETVLDSQPVADGRIPVVDDGQVHEVRVVLGANAPGQERAGQHTRADRYGARGRP